MSQLTRVLASRVRARRRVLGLTQAAVAEGAGVSTELVSRIERARCLPSLPTLVALARCLKTTPDELLDFDRPGPSRDVEELLAVLRSLPAARRREVRRIAEALALYERRG